MGVYDCGLVVLIDGGEEVLLSDWLFVYFLVLGVFWMQFGDQLLFLFKVFDVWEMLFIQLYFIKEQVEKGFVIENEVGVLFLVYYCNFKDDNYKLEVMVVFMDFWLLYGFRLEVEIVVIFELELVFLLLYFFLKELGIYGLYKIIMEWLYEQVDEVL